ncbi:MAG: asparaginase [Bacteroidetes bacterium]|nr:asparaginase [Bacteroidota bacterium]MDA1120636.1 asparaginase [Bacteroidota bacterium]
MINYQQVDVTTSRSTHPKASLLIIYTGGTFGMAYGKSSTLIPFDFKHVIKKIPELGSLDLKITVFSFTLPIDSSNVHTNHWRAIGHIIMQNYEEYDGFVVLHGTDTMSYSASALSFMFQNLTKPIIFTGAQIPIGTPRSDARDNFLTAIEIASDKKDGQAIVPEVCVYFNHRLLRANRSQKVRSSRFGAFESENYPDLAVSGVLIEYNTPEILRQPDEEMIYSDSFDSNVVLFKLFPNIQQNMMEALLNINGLKGLVIESYGSGNTPNYPWFLECLEEANNRGIVILNVSQCIGGHVIHGRYETSRKLSQSGVLSGSDMTTEAAITKMMLLLGTYNDSEKVKRKLILPTCGEITP